MDTRDIIIALLIGLVAGWLASFIVGGSGFVRYLISGVIGSFVGSFLLSRLGVNLGINNEVAKDIVMRRPAPSSSSSSPGWLLNRLSSI